MGRRVGVLGIWFLALAATARAQDDFGGYDAGGYDFSNYDTSGYDPSSAGSYDGSSWSDDPSSFASQGLQASPGGYGPFDSSSSASQVPQASSGSYAPSSMTAPSQVADDYGASTFSARDVGAGWTPGDATPALADPNAGAVSGWGTDGWSSASQSGGYQLASLSPSAGLGTTSSTPSGGWTSSLTTDAPTTGDSTTSADTSADTSGERQQVAFLGPLVPMAVQTLSRVPMSVTQNPTGVSQAPSSLMDYLPSWSRLGDAIGWGGSIPPGHTYVPAAVAPDGTFVPAHSIPTPPPPGTPQVPMSR